MLRSGAHALYKEQADVDELPRAKHSGDERVQQRGLVAPEPVTAVLSGSKKKTPN